MTGVDIAALARVLDGDHAELRTRARETLSRPSFAYRYGLDREAYRALVMRWLRDLLKDGSGLTGYPAEVGGAGDAAGAVALFETVAFHDLSLLVKLGVQIGLYGGAITQLGTEEHHRELLRAAGTAAVPGCFAMTETGHGSNVREVGTLARYDPEGDAFEIHTPDRAARKDYIGNAAAHGRMAVVFAQLEVGGESHGVHALLVPIRDARGKPRQGIRIEDCGEKMGLNGVDNGRIAFDHVRVPRTALLNRFADVDAEGRYSSSIEDPSRRFFTMLGALIQGRVCIAAASVSAAKSALTIAIRYANRRRQFGPPGGEEVALLDYRTHQRRLLPALATTYALDFAVKDLVAAYAKSQTATKPSARDRRRLEAHAAGLKAYATWHALETIRACREACGGAGYLAENRFAALAADTEVFTTFEGDNTVLLQLVARSLLTDYREEFGDLNLLTTMRYLAGRVRDVIAEAAPVGLVAGVMAAVPLPGREQDDDALRDRRSQLAAMAWREQHQLDGLGRRLRKGMKEDPFGAFIAAQDHVVGAAMAHVDRVVLESFDARIRKVRAKGTRSVLDRLADLHALSRIERDRGWFLEHGHLTTGRSKAVVRQVNDACWDLRPVAEDLVDAFSIPDQLLGAPIARR
jgi:acyl-CoA oxidase